jgi:hypothetical protein
MLKLTYVGLVKFLQSPVKLCNGVLREIAVSWALGAALSLCWYVGTYHLINTKLEQQMKA